MWDKHRQVIAAEERLSQTVVGMVPWMDDDDRHNVIVDWERAAGLDPATYGGVETISLDDFRAEIGAPPLPREPESKGEAVSG